MNTESTSTNKQKQSEPGKTKRRGLIAFLFGERKSSDDNSFRVALIFMTFGFVAILLGSIWAAIVKGQYVWMNTLGLSVLVGLAASIVGGLLGFLFGIPRSLQREGDSTVKDPQENRQHYSNNTNLEQISDWLTKIIVGVSLMQLPKLENRFDLLTSRIASGYGDAFSEEFGYALAGSVMVFYAICGFLAVYLWTRIYLKQQLINLENNLYGKKLQKQVEKVSNLEIANLSSMLTEFNRTRNRIMGLEHADGIRLIIEKASPDPPRFIEDFQKGRWGGKSKVGNYIISGAVKSHDDGIHPFLVKVTVKSISGDAPLLGTVYFFMHDSFENRYITAAEVVDNSASIEFVSFEAFTVGAVLNEGAVKLELDLNELADCPPDYKYQGPLATIDDVREELDDLKKSQEENEKNRKASAVPGAM